jgi:ABC-2 type transport system ATP-binding protein
MEEELAMNAVLDGREAGRSSVGVVGGTLNEAGIDVAASLDGVSKRYRNGVLALDGVSLELRAGEVTALLGPNGAGKSTAVKLMLGLTSATAGTVQVFGQDPRLASSRVRTGAMLQVGKVAEMLRVKEHVELFRGYYPQPMPYAEIVKAAGLEGIEKRLLGELSGGQKQRLLFALALAGDPDLLFLDEPTVGLDIESRRLLWAQIRGLAERGKTVLLTTHYLEEADALANRIVVIDKGKMICQGTPDEVKAIASGRAGGAVKLIRCVTSIAKEELLRLTGVVDVERVGGRLVVTSFKPEATLREMLVLDAELGELEVQRPALEDAFLALTGSDE